MVILAVLFFAAHYYIYAVPANILRETLLISSSALLGLCLFGSIFLLSTSQNTRLRKVLALQMLIVSLAAGFTLIQIVINNQSPATTSQLLSPGMLIYGNIYALVLLLYPLELLCSEHVRLGFYVKSLLFLFAMIIIYFGYTHLSRAEITMVESWRCLLSNLHKFDIWFRLMILFYPAGLFLDVMRHKRRYIRWCGINSIKASDTNLRWLNYYLFGYSLILISYMIMALSDHYQNFIMLSFTYLIFFCFTSYCIIHQKVTTLSKSAVTVSGYDTMFELDEDSLDISTDDISESKYRFSDKIPQYKSDLERWMQEQRPYRNKDFKLLDVMQVLPLNRSYISHLFNEGYGETFFNFVMRYRINESGHLLENHPEMNIRQISDLCGFSSPSVFGRAFLKNKGVTPKQYRIYIKIGEQ